MELTEQQYNELLQRLKNDLQVGSQGVGEIPLAKSLEGIVSLPAFQPIEGKDMPDIVEAPLTLLATPALDAEKMIKEAESKRVEAETGRAKAEEKRVAEFGTLKQESQAATAEANAAAERVDESITDISQEKQAAVEATERADAAAGLATGAAEEANAKAILANLAAEAANAAASLADEKAALADEKAGLANEAATTIDTKMQEKINALIANAPEALDTLVELAVALGNDPNFATTMATELGKKINKADIINDLITGGSSKVASAETVKMLDASKIGSLFFTTISKPMTNDEFSEIITPDAHTLYIVTLPGS